jgi:hypothetical protein
MEEQGRLELDIQVRRGPPAPVLDVGEVVGKVLPDR